MRLFKLSRRSNLLANMAVHVSIVIEGVLKTDGTIELRSRPAIPPGPVWVRLEAVSRGQLPAAQLPDQPWEAEASSAPFDLPFPGEPQPVNPLVVDELLPDALEWTGEDAHP